MPYVPPHLRNKAPADGADAAAAPPPSGGKSLADLAASAPAGGDRRDRGERTSGERGERNSGERRDNGGGRDGGRRGGGGGRSRASAPKAFGTIAGRKTMEPHEDIENGERVDGEGMVYRMVDADESGGPAATYFCDRFRRYRFHCGEAGLMLLAALVRKLEACLELNEERFDPDAARAEEQRKQGYVLYEEIGLPVICLTTPGCRLADLRETALGKRVRFKPEWPCESVLQSRERCWQELWHPVKARDCLLSDRSQAALRACAKAPRRKRNARGLPHIYGVGSA